MLFCFMSNFNAQKEKMTLNMRRLNNRMSSVCQACFAGYALSMQAIQAIQPIQAM